MDKSMYVKNIAQLLPAFEEHTASIVSLKGKKKRRFYFTNIFMVFVSVCFSLYTASVGSQLAMTFPFFLSIIFVGVFSNYSALKDVFLLREQLTKNMKVIMTASEIVDSKEETNENLLVTLVSHLEIDGSELSDKSVEVSFRVKER